MSCWSFGPRVPSDLFFQVKPDRTSTNLSFSQQFCAITLHHYTTQKPGRHTTFRCGLLPFGWLSGEVKHIVHLIRLTLEAVYALVADWNTVPVQGIIARLLGI